MSFRDKMNQNPAITTGVTFAIIVFSLAFMVWMNWPFGEGGYSVTPKSFYTTDDSSQEAAIANLFSDDATRIPPFDHNGKPAYRAVVYTYGSEKRKHVYYLERYTPEGKRKLAEYMEAQKKAQAGGPSGTAASPDAIASSEKEYMKPGLTKWARQSDARNYSLTMSPPEGANAQDMEPLLAP